MELFKKTFQVLLGFNFLAPGLKNSSIFSKKALFIFQEETCKSYKIKIYYTFSKKSTRAFQDDC